MGFSVRHAVLVFVFGGVIALAFALHRLQPQAHKTCNYTNWVAPCHTSGWHVDWTDVTAGGIVLVATIATGLIVGTRRKQKTRKKMSSAAPQSQRA